MKKIESILKTMRNEKTIKKGSQRLQSNNIFELVKHKFLWHNKAFKGYEYTDGIKEILTDIVMYFNGQKCCLDLDKGLWLYGTFGVGKTTIFDITREYLADVKQHNPNAYRISSVEKIINHFKTEKDLDIFGYNVKVDDRGLYKDPINLLINEIGTESEYEIKNYGSVFRDEFKSMLMARYEVFVDFGKVTHVTSNVEPDKLYELYDEKLVDRFIEMFNFVELKGKSFRK